MVKKQLLEKMQRFEKSFKKLCLIQKLYKKLWSI